jgi:threonine/homoserine/homoserine lactone efflux protein
VTDPIAFALASLALLATPGPTNTLLATSGATAGLKRSLPLIGAELSGYAISIAALALAIAPLLNGSPLISVVLRLACGAYLVWSAVHLWREGSSALTSGRPVSFGRVFTTTLLNPKGVVFALVIIPYLGERRLAEAAPYLAGLSGLMVAVALSWISGGALIGAGARGRVDAGVIRKAGAMVLGLFGVLLSGSVLSAVGR